MYVLWSQLVSSLLLFRYLLVILVRARFLRLSSLSASLIRTIVFQWLGFILAWACCRWISGALVSPLVFSSLLRVWTI